MQKYTCRCSREVERTNLASLDCPLATNQRLKSADFQYKLNRKVKAKIEFAYCFIIPNNGRDKPCAGKPQVGLMASLL